MNANERFEYIAGLFYKATGYMAPGKDSPAGFYTEEDREIAAVKWEEFVELFHSDLFELHKSNANCIENN